MDNNSLYEYSVAPKNQSFQKTIMTILKVLRYLNIVLCILFTVFAFFYSTQFIIFAAMSLITIIVLLFGGRLFYNYYDISYVSGSIRIIKVVNNAYRKMAVTFETKDIITVGRVLSPAFDKYAKDKSVKRIYASPNRLTENDFCVYCSTKYGQTLVYMQYDEKFISYLLRGAGVKVFTKDFIEYLRVQQQ